MTRAAAVVAVLVIAAGGFWLRWNEQGRQAMPDTYWYTRQALIYGGAGTARAAEAASGVECASRNASARELGLRPACHHYPSGRPDPRYARIFTTRPGFSLLAAPLVALAGAWRGMASMTALACLLAAVLAFAAVRGLGGSPVAGLAAGVLLFALPSGYWITRMLPEGAMLAGCLAAGIGATMLWPHPAGPGHARASPAGPGRARVLGGTAMVAAGLLWTYAIKSANGFLLSVVLLAGGAAAGLWLRTGTRRAARAGRRAAWVLASLGLAGTAGWIVVSSLAHLPSFDTTIQDMASRHFRGRLTPDPAGYLLRRDAWFIPHWILFVAGHPWSLAVATGGIAALALTCRARSVPWLLAGATGPLAVAAHPIGSEADRLVLPLWLPVILGLAAAADRAGRWALRHWDFPRPVAWRSPRGPAADSVSYPPARR